MEKEKEFKPKTHKLSQILDNLEVMKWTFRGMKHEAMVEAVQELIKKIHKEFT